MDEIFMQAALDEAWRYQLLTYPNPAVGCVIVKNGSLVAVGAHEKAGCPHAEVNACKAAFLRLCQNEDAVTALQSLQNSNEIHEFLYVNHGGLFHGCTIYTTLEPCVHYGRTPPCAKLILILGFDRVVIGSLDINEQATGGAKELFKGGVKVQTGVLRSECDALLEPFLKWQKGSFVLFKMAMTLNGTIDTGVISGVESRRFVHDVRDKLDLLVVGGQTVRTDRPTLDARMAGGRACDVLILSHRDDFDHDIPLFGVPNRKVEVQSGFDGLKNRGFVMIEGGYSMLASCRDVVDWYLFFVSPVIKKGQCEAKFDDVNLSIVRRGLSGRDSTIWAKPQRSENG